MLSDPIERAMDMFPQIDFVVDKSLPTLALAIVFFVIACHAILVAKRVVRLTWVEQVASTSIS